MSSFSFVKPMSFTSEIISAYSVPQDVSLYDSGTSYSAGEQVRIDELGLVRYESLIDNNIGNDPNAAETNWVLIDSPTNYAGMFDNSVGTKTAADAEIDITLNTSGFIDTVALIGIDKIRTITVTCFSVGKQVYSETKSAYKRRVNGIAGVWFGKHRFISDVLFSNLPKFKDMQVRVHALSDTGTQVEIGGLVIGVSESLGKAQWEFSTSRKSYSVVKEDEFGGVKFVKRYRSAKRLDIKLRLHPSRVAFVEEQLAKYDVEPLLWVASEDYKSTIIYGVYDNFNHLFKSSTTAFNTLKLKGIG